MTVPLEWTFETVKGPLHLALSFTPVGSSNMISIFGVYVKGRRRLFYRKLFCWIRSCFFLRIIS